MAFELQPTLDGSLVCLRPLRSEDFDAVFAVASDPKIWEQHPNHDRWQEPVFREFFRVAMESGGAFVVTDAKTGEVIGSSRYANLDEDAGSIEIGWTFLARSHWGGAYNGEMKQMMLRHAFQFVESVVFVIGPNNVRSRKAVERIGGRLIESGLDPLRGDRVLYEIRKPREDVIAYTSQPLREKPEWLRERLEWFQDQKFGLILHWGTYALWDCCESWPLSPGDEWARNDNMECWTSRGKDLDLFQRDYWALNREFNPVDYDPNIWAEAAQYAGIRYVAMTTKHHDGFCMWDTATTDYKISGPDCPFHTDPRADVFKGLCDAFQSRGMAISAYFSKADWHSPHYWSPDKPVTTRQANTSGTPEWDKFVDFTHQQIRELMTNYGKIDILWLDAGWVKDERNESLDMPGMIAMARELQPGLIVANRTVGDDFEDFITPEHQIPDAPLAEPWESCLCMAENWKYHPRDRYRPTSEVLRMLIEIVSKGGNFLLGVGPTPEGKFTDQALTRLREIGDWMAINGEAIHGTRAIAPYSEGETRFTQKSGQTFAFLLDPSVRHLAALRPKGELRLLGIEEPIAWQETPTGIQFDLPSAAATLPQPVVLAW